MASSNEHDEEMTNDEGITKFEADAVTMAAADSPATNPGERRKRL